MCLNHLTEHAQTLEDPTPSKVELFEEKLIELRSQLDLFKMPTKFIENPYVELEKWRHESRIKLNKLAEDKRKEIESKQAEFQSALFEKIRREKEKVESTRKIVRDAVRQNKLKSRESKLVEKNIESIEHFLRAAERSSIKVVSSEFVVEIRTSFFDENPSSSKASSSGAGRLARLDFRSNEKDRNRSRTDKKRSSSLSLI